MSATLLTTPHGDQEPSAPSPASVSARSPSLPLMGIRNQRQQREQGLEVGISLPLMGIRNTPPGVARRGELDSHYPSWGSGTQLSPSPSPRPAGAHYPSWGSGTCHNSLGPAPQAWISLPLMGIRNHVVAQRSSRPGAQLTTPHGDQEPWRRRRAAQARLTTPHGDQEHPTSATASSSVSLPLMGIRNRSGLAAANDRQLATSLPLMGIRNRDRPGDHRSKTAGVSLPLMGIRNPVRAARSWTSPPSPHYPSWGSGTARLYGSGQLPVNPSSLPLMGIRNSRFALFAGLGVVSSLPLMGIRNCSRPAALASSLPLMGIRSSIEPRPHYPSWGSGTCPGAVSDHCRTVIDLTTPHGDQEQLGIRGTRRERPAHYPSWGSGTGPADARGSVRSCTSLPLMGIRNLDAGKPSSRPATTHYPSWGSGTRQGMEPHEFAGDSTHYPSWGSGTTPTRPGRVRVRGLHLTTPHGDQEPRHA